tara:strand:+ start:671 stop:1012 length:342 start_codon:yes stop_codon:yes gene_type:complete
VKWLINRLYRLLLRWAVHTDSRYFGGMKSTVNFVYCQVGESLDNEALALVRFTSYDSDSRALAVEQVTYQDTPVGFTNFERHVAAALDCGVDVAVMTSYDLDYFPVVESLVTS